MNDILNNTYRPFANGSQFADWEATNCERCAKGDDKCPFQEALWMAYFDAGTITADTARAIGYLHDNDTLDERYVWPCAVVEWAEWWKRKRMEREP